MAPALQAELSLGGAPAAVGEIPAAADLPPLVVEPRQYQSETIEALFQWWRTRPGENPLVVLPTASGKTIIFSLLTRQILTSWSGVRVLILAHRQELIAQARNKLLRVYPDAPVGIYCAGLGYKQIRQVTVASRDSIAALNADGLQGGFDIVVIDEAHLVSEDEVTRYQQIIATNAEVKPRATVAGFTATPYRTDSGYIYGADSLFAGVAYQKSMREMVRDGFLAEIRAAATRNRTDTSGIRTSMGDFNQKQLAARATEPDLLDRQLDEYLSLASDRQCTAFFCVNVQHALLVSERLAERGLDVPALHGKTPASDRRAILQSLDDGLVDGVANVGVLTEGWDCPRLDCISILRPTKSLALFIQMVGRGLRPSPDTGKEDCLLLDFGGCLERFGPLDRARPAAKGRQQERDRVKECRKCEHLAPLAAKTCPNCGEDFGCECQVCEQCGAENSLAAAQCEACGAILMPEDLSGSAAAAPVWSDQTVVARNVQCFEVDRMSLRTAEARSSGKTYLRVSYFASGSMEVFSDILCLGYSGFAGTKAMRKIRKMLKDEYRGMPSTDPDTFMKWHEGTPGGMLKEPRAVYVDLDTEWNDVTHVEYWTDETRAAVAAIESGAPDPLIAALDDEIPF